jgi:hypothetical protein
MRKLVGVGITLMFLLASLAVVAQEYPKAEVFGGYQYTRTSGTGLNGWNAAVNGNLNHWFGVTGDFSGQYKSLSGVDLRNYTYTFGPTLSARQIRTFTPFVHGLFGGFHQSLTGFSGVSGFTMAFGGGVDAAVGHRWGVRLGQFDWLSFRANGVTTNDNFRYSAGLVLKF